MIKNNKGFSFIEVLVTVGLIGILVGIAVPSYTTYKKNTITMALKADLGSGTKTYSAKYAVDSTYCHRFADVGLPEDRSDNPIYRKGGFYGFGDLSTVCGGFSLLDDVSWESNDKECYNSTTKVWTPIPPPLGTCPTGSVETTKAGISYDGGAPALCVLNPNSFLMGATTNVSAVDDFYYANQDGVIKQSSTTKGSFNCSP